MKHEIPEFENKPNTEYFYLYKQHEINFQYEQPAKRNFNNN